MKQLSFSTWLTFVMLAFFVAAVGISMGFPAKARFMPLVVGLPGIAFCLIQLAIDLRPSKRAFHGAPRAGTPDMPEAEPELPEFGPHTVHRELAMWTYFVGFVVGILALGFYVAMPIMLVTFLRREADSSWKSAIAYAVVATTVIFLMFGKLLGIQLFPGFVTPLLLAPFGMGEV